MDSEQIHRRLVELYLSPSKPSSLGGVDRLWRAAKTEIPNLKKSDVKRFLEGQYAYTRLRPSRKKFKRRKVIAVDIGDVYQMDLVDLQKFAEFNDGFKHLLTVIDCFTRYGFAIPLKSKKPGEIIEALSTIFKDYGLPTKVFTDKGTEFLNKDVKSFLKELSVQQWYSQNPGKAVQVERFNRTLKERLWVHMTDKNYYRYIDVLNDVLKGYNDTVHSSTGFAPSAITNDDVITILDNMMPEKTKRRTARFEAGDKVRVATNKLTFEKGYESKYSEKLFEIVKIRISHGKILYQIKDLAGRVEPGWFYEEELSKVVIDEHEVHRISKIIRQRTVKGKLQYLVHWVGYPSAFDSWEFVDQLKT